MLLSQHALKRCQVYMICCFLQPFKHAWNTWLQPLWIAYNYEQ